MAKKATEATGKPVEIKQEKAEAGATEIQQNAETGAAGTQQNVSGFYIYIGPNLKKLIQTGTVYRGTRRNALAKAADAIKAQPLVKTLIVSGDALPEARLKVRTPGNILYANYQKLAGKEGK